MAALYRGPVAAYCVAWSRWVKAELAILRTGEVVKAPSGFPIQNPWLAISNRAQMQMQSLAAEFGMSASSKSRITASKPVAQSALKLFAAQRGA